MYLRIAHFSLKNKTKTDNHMYSIKKIKLTTGQFCIVENINSDISVYRLLLLIYLHALP